MVKNNSSILALDVGERRIGVAVASTIARIAHPLTTLLRSDQSVHDIQALITEHDAQAVAVGYPRGLNGQSTAQTAATEAFVRELKRVVTVPLYFQDEAVTSRQAEAELQSRGKPYVKGDIDALAATYILEDFLREHVEAPA
ncbi:MAG TPA: Holliday junction resolvase RuvX [Candidatus Saccharimonadales bacterium]|jgi:putative Holliday junction resolvase|nr:Holliday junction resolvase RuvX [Candidatus Saccharimonadales bacterium]